MRQLLVLACIGLFTSCGFFEPKDPVDNPTTCKVEDVEEGVMFTCIDKDGIESSGVVRNGEQGAEGERGPAGADGIDGRDGPDGRSLAPIASIYCGGSIEGWMESSSYEVEFLATVFETEDKFLRVTTTLQRGDDLVNRRDASAFILATNPELKLDDGRFSYELVGLDLLVKSRGGVDVSLDCEVM